MERCIASVQLQQLVMCPLLDDGTVLEHHNQIGVLIVDSRCAMMSVVLPRDTARNCRRICRSVTASSDEVASSNT